MGAQHNWVEAHSEQPLRSRGDSYDWGTGRAENGEEPDTFLCSSPRSNARNGKTGS